MNQAELNTLEQIRLDVLEQLRTKYGDEKVQKVDDLGDAITSRMIYGEVIEGIPQWMYDIVQDFVSMISNHPNVILPKLN